MGIGRQSEDFFAILSVNILRIEGSDAGTPAAKRASDWELCVMDGNYEWQSFRADEKLRSRRQEAEAHRQGKEVEGDGRSSVIARILVSLRIGWAALTRYLLREGPPDTFHSRRPEERERLV